MSGERRGTEGVEGMPHASSSRVDARCVDAVLAQDFAKVDLACSSSSSDFRFAPPAAIGLWRYTDGVIKARQAARSLSTQSGALPSASALLARRTAASGFSAAALLYSPAYLLFHLVSITTTPFMVSHLIRARRMQDFEAALDRWIDECEPAPAERSDSAQPSPMPAGISRRNRADRSVPGWASAGRRGFATSAVHGTVEASFRRDTPSFLPPSPSFLARTSADDGLPVPTLDSTSSGLSQSGDHHALLELRKAVNDARSFDADLLNKARQMMDIVNLLGSEVDEAEFNLIFVALRHVQRLQKRHSVTEGARAAEQRLEEAWLGKAADLQVSRWRTAQGLLVHQHRHRQFSQEVVADRLAEFDIPLSERDQAAATIRAYLPKANRERPDLFEQINSLRSSGSNKPQSRPLCACQQTPPPVDLLEWPNLDNVDVWPLAYLLEHRSRGTAMSAETWLRGVDIALVAGRWDLAALMLTAGPGSSCSARPRKHRGLLFDTIGSTNRQLRQEKELALALRGPLDPTRLFAVRLAAEQALRHFGQSTSAIPAGWLAVFDRCLNQDLREGLVMRHIDPDGLRQAGRLLGRDLSSEALDDVAGKAAECLDRASSSQDAYTGADTHEQAKIFVILMGHCAKRRSPADVSAFFAMRPESLDLEDLNLLVATLQAATRHPREFGPGSQLVAALGRNLSEDREGPLDLASADTFPAAVTAILDYAFRPASTKEQRRAAVRALFPGVFDGNSDQLVHPRDAFPPLPPSPQFYVWLLQRLAGCGDVFMGGRVAQIAKAARAQHALHRHDGDPVPTWDFPIAFYSALVQLCEAAAKGDSATPRGPLFGRFHHQFQASTSFAPTRSWVVGWTVRDLIDARVVKPLRAMSPDARSSSDLRPDRQFYQTVASALTWAARDPAARHANLRRLDDLVVAFGRLGLPFPSDIMQFVADELRKLEATSLGGGSSLPTGRGLGERLREARNRFRHRMSVPRGPSAEMPKRSLHWYIDRRLEATQEIERRSGKARYLALDRVPSEQ